MAIRYATKTGNWSDVTVWDGGTTFPTSGDTVVANTFTVTVDTNQNIGSGTIQTAAAGGGAAGGGFVLANGVTLTANIGIGTAIVLTFSAATGTIVGNVANSGTGAVCVTNTGTGTLTITGNVTGGGAGVNQHGLTNTSSGTVSITGNVLSGANGIGVVNSSTGTINVIGNVTGAGSTAMPGISNTSTGPVNVTGNVTGGGASGAHGINNASTAQVTVTGNVSASPTTSAAGINSATAGKIVVAGTVTASAFSPAVISTSSTAYNAFTGPLVDDATGFRAVYSQTLAIAPSTTIASTSWKFAQQGAVVPNYNGFRFMYTAGVSIGNPTNANVRSGTVFGANNELTGTLLVPSPSYVLLGVGTDNTVGSFVSPALLQTTTIATLASQISFTLTAGSPDDNAYNNQIIIVTNAGNPLKRAIGTIASYVGSTRTVTLAYDPAVFTMAVGDSVSVVVNSTGGAFAEFTVGSSSSTAVVNTNRTEADNFWNHSIIAFTSGSLRGIASKVTSYANASGAFTVLNTLPGTPATGDKGIIIGAN